MNHTEPGDGKTNLGLTTTTFDTLYAGETAITFNTGYIASIGNALSTIFVPDACVPEAIYSDFISQFQTATGLDLSAGVTAENLVYPTLKIGNQHLKLALSEEDDNGVTKYYCKNTAATYFAFEPYLVVDDMALFALAFGATEIPPQIN